MDTAGDVAGAGEVWTTEAGTAEKLKKKRRRGKSTTALLDSDVDAMVVDYNLADIAENSFRYRIALTTSSPISLHESAVKDIIRAMQRLANFLVECIPPSVDV